MPLIHNPNWAISSSGESISLFQSQQSLKSPLLFIGGVHGDEPEGVELAEKLINWINFSANPYELKDWALIPCINPDGYKKNQRVNGNEVDLNRNYPSKNWKPIKAGTKKRYNPGPHPGSEPEIKSLVKLIQDIQPLIIIHFHSWEPCIVVTGEPGLKFATPLSESSGYKIIPTIGYDTPGGLSQYAWHDLKIPVICIEEQEHIDLDKVWPNFKDGLIKILQKDF